MANAFFHVPPARNEPVKSYAPNSPERRELQATLRELLQHPVEVPMRIGNQDVFTDDRQRLAPPHNHRHTLGYFHQGTSAHVQQAIAAALAARTAWAATPWHHRAAVFLKAAELLAGPWRARVNAATMLGQSKNAFQAEIDAACELIDFFRFNAQFLQQIYQNQPESLPGTWNRVEYRALEGFVFALTPFNFTSIAANLPAAPALMGNVVVWKPANTQIYSAHVLMELFRAAGLPDGVINLMFVDGPTAGDVIFQHREFAGIHFTGSTGVFDRIWQTVGANRAKYRSYPRLVGETGGKDFVVAHPSADPVAVAVGLLRGAFEYQGQKCSAASRAYVPQSLWPAIKERLVHDLKTVRMGDVFDFRNFVNAVIDEKSFDKLAKFIDAAKADAGVELVAGGGHDKTVGYFIEPTVLRVDDPKYVTMCEELFGPVLTIHIYEDAAWAETLKLVDDTSPYALTGAVFAQDRAALLEAETALVNAAGNFYLNDKPTGAVVGQQPFGGARASGTNDKAGSSLNLLRWVSVRTIKETLVPPTDYRYPFLADDSPAAGPHEGAI